MTAHFHNPSLTIHLPGRHLAVPDHGGLKNTSQSRFSSASLQQLWQHTCKNNAEHPPPPQKKHAFVFRLFRRRRTGVDGHISPEEILPVTSGKSHSHTRGKQEDKGKEGLRWATPPVFPFSPIRGPTCIQGWQRDLHLNGVPLMSV